MVKMNGRVGDCELQRWLRLYSHHWHAGFAYFHDSFKAPFMQLTTNLILCETEIQMLHANDENINFLCSTHPVITGWKIQLNSTNLQDFLSYIEPQIDHSDQHRGQKQLTHSSYWC